MWDLMPKASAGPMENEEAIIYTDMDIEECIKHKLAHDFAGHYNREDSFQLFINKSDPHLVKKSRIQYCQ